MLDTLKTPENNTMLLPTVDPSTSDSTEVTNKDPKTASSWDFVQSAAAMFEAVGFANPQKELPFCEDFILGLKCVTPEISPHSLSELEQKSVVDQLGKAAWKAVFIASESASLWAHDAKNSCRALGAVWPSSNGDGFHAAVWDWRLLSSAEQKELATSVQSGVIFAHHADELVHALVFHSGKTDSSSCIVDSWNIMRLAAPERRRLQRNTDKEDTERRARIKDGEWGYTLVDLLHYTGLVTHDIPENGHELGKKLKAEKNISIPMMREILRRAIAPLIILDRHFIMSQSRTEMDASSLPLSSHIRSACSNAMKIVMAIEDQCPMYMETMEPAYQTLANMTFRGIPWDWKAAHSIEQKSHETLVDTVDTIHGIACLEALVPHERALKNYKQSITDELHLVWSSILERESDGLEIPVTFTGKKTLSIPKLKASGFHEGHSAPAFEVLDKIQSTKTEIEFFSRMRRWTHSSEGGPLSRKNGTEQDDIGRIHSLLMLGPETDRLASRDPNSQAMPKDDSVRRLVKAKVGHSIVAVDYSQLDLRMAAALGLRVQTEIWNEIQASGPQSGVIWTLGRMDDLSEIRAMEANLLAVARTLDEEVNEFLDYFADKETQSKKYKSNAGPQYHVAWMNKVIAWRNVFWARVRALQVQKNTPVAGRLAQVFRDHLDPHLVTGLHMSLGGDVEAIFDRLRAARDAGTMIDLQAQHAPERKKAKPINFGLLYGISAEHLHEQGVAEYGLDWTVDDAEKGSESWFSLYPEVGLWRYQTMCTPILSEMTVVPESKGSWKGVSGLKEKHTHTWRVTSLDGRVYERNSWKEALNYQDQGTGAHVILRAMNRMPYTSRQYLINQVHDELVAEAPTEKAVEIMHDMTQAMILAGEEILKPYGIPVEVDGGTGPTWADC